MIVYIGYFFLAFVLSVCVTGGIAYMMRRLGIIDQAHATSRKIHTRPIPLGGGLGLYIVFFFTSFSVFFLSRGRFSEMDFRVILGMLFGSTVLMIGGLIDDKYTLRPRLQILFPIAAAILAVVFGIGSSIISNPFGGTIDLSQIQWSLGLFGDIVLFADILVFCWLFGMMYTTKFLDGLDGLVTGIISIGAVIIGLLALQPAWFEPNIALLSIIFAGTCLGFLVWNFNPAKIFLGEGGSLFTGFILGCLAITADSKVTITMLVMGLPMIDILRVIVMRVKKGKPVYEGDREHLHYRLIESGFSQRQAVFLFYAISFVFGMSALFLQAEHGLIALVFLFILMLLLGFWFSTRGRKNS